ncbi:glycoside hydrolase family 2 TIM barrel-domain containing protein [Wenyingzhuangia sp. chi5]|uniref:beta-galactosidase n=1 Tax=Wenyingzhuangia gilva TaxID=3057677 RepID=A0ABT8VTD6_9FLAO|nr:glycoside hydrolase family 2 TIM barrel-domain containing protein [Wenyingzhuangia sp. chi5]MDO3695242.1 glycoside hydrolase family 2 TIM barrel-domain containing protein [Wenyingzhuangia sp. chi5]
MKFLKLTIILIALSISSCTNKDVTEIDLSGTWQFKIDSLNQGVSQKWYIQKLTEEVNLPGSMTENDKGNDISLNTKWTGQIVDSAWYYNEKYAKYRDSKNLKIPFWLQPNKHYVGVAWYQKEFEVSKDWQSKAVELTLERPHWETKVWIDDHYIGMQNSLGTSHNYNLGVLEPGTHTLSIRIDNAIHKINPGINAHSITDHTQTNWNGIVGDIKLEAKPIIAFQHVKIFPDVTNKKVKVTGKIKNTTGENQSVKFEIKVVGVGENNHQLETIDQEIEIDSEGDFTMDYAMGDDVLLWDEFNPNLYKMELALKSQYGTDYKGINFGMREFKAKGTQFVMNGKPIFLRGTLECAVFPITGYPSTDINDWKRILNIIKDHGLNHVRFHSWCPPEAAFNAADELGVYIQAEASTWPNGNSSIGNGNPVDEWLYKETQDILDAYGNHPSFVMMTSGNEPLRVNHKPYLRKYVNHFRKQDNRRLYTGAADRPYLDNLDYYNNSYARIQRWGEGLNSIINKSPQTDFDYNYFIDTIPMPYVSHEIGQWCAYPNYKEMSKYTGVLKPKNFEIFKESLENNHLGYLADSLLLASGKLQALCYKADIEAALRTKGFGGFQLLGLSDFPGQGTALVGVLDAFWEEKGYISPEEFRRFCNETVPLARLKKRIFLNNENFEASVEVAHFGKNKLVQASSTWELINVKGDVVFKGAFDKKDIPLNNGIPLGHIKKDLTSIKSPEKLTLVVHVNNFSNSWDVWVYPSEKEKINEKEVKVVNKLDTKTISYLENGGNVLLNLTKGSIKPEKGGSVGIGFSSIFWNTAWTLGEKPHTLGVLCNPNHPALAEFPTEYHSNWQWWDAMSHSNAIILDEFTPNLKPIVRVVDDWFTNRSLGLVFEVKIGKGKLIVSGVDLTTDLKNRPEAQQLLYSLKKYMISEDFNPAVTLEIKSIIDLYK